jgi:ligand-binding sensor domain-containing protein
MTFRQNLFALREHGAFGYAPTTAPQLFRHHSRQRNLRQIPFAWLAVLPLLAIFFPVPSPLNAQVQDLKFEHFSIEDGLSHSKVNSIFQDDRGFLWFGTNDGLNKFDGYEFTVYRWKPNEPAGLSAQLVRAVFQDHRGTLWIGTEGGGVNVFDRASESFFHYTSDSTSEIRISSQDVNSIIEDRRGNLWLGTSNGLDLFDLQNKKVTNYIPPHLDHAPARAKIVNVVYEDKQNNLWVGTLNSGLWLFDRDGKSFTSYRHDPRDPKSLGDDDVRSIHEDAQGNLWVGTTFGGLNLFDRRKKTFRRFFLEKNDPEGATIRAIIDDGAGRLWVGTRFGLYKVDAKTFRFVDYQHDPNNPYSLSHNSVQCIFKDAKGDLWVGTRDGLNFINTHKSSFMHFQAKTHDRRFLNNKVVYAILEDQRGNLWFGTEEGGLNCLDRKSGLLTYYLHDGDNPHSLSVNNIKALREDRDGNLWIGTFQGGLNFFERRTQRFFHYQHRPEDSRSLAGNGVMSLLLDDEGTLWVGTLENGLDIFDKRHGRFTHFFEAIGAPGYRMICSLMQDRQGRIWIGSNRGRLGCWDKKKKEFKHYQLPLNNIITIEIRPIVEDETGNLWIGTTGGGLFFFDRNKETFTSFTIQHGLPSNIIYGILQDEQKNLWLSTTNGLAKFDPKTKEIKKYYKENGLQSNQFCYNAYFKSRRGEMFFGGINGVTAFYPGNIRENAYVPPVAITGLKIFNKPIEIGGPDGILKKSIAETREISISHRQSVFSFDFAALNYATSAQNQYAYKMEGFDKDWNWVGNRRFATYTNLNPGTYTFRVKAANNDGAWNEKGASIRVTIAPSFWQTWWFKVLIGAALLLLAKHFYDYQAQKRNVIEATSLANLSQLKLLRYQMNPHFLFNAHNSIRSMILIDKERAWQMITELSEFLRYTLLTLNKVEASLDDEINAVNNYLHIEKIRYLDSLDVSFHIDEAARQCPVPAFILQPVVENAIKYGMQTSPMPLKVAVSVMLNERSLSIDVSNTGELLGEGSHKGSIEEVHGTSLANLKQRLELMFEGNYAFQLYEENGWVHAKIRINYKPAKPRHKIFRPFAKKAADVSA